MADLERILSIHEQFGGPPDAFIILTLEGLSELGFTTMDSCQGHPDASNTGGVATYPYVGFNFEHFSEPDRGQQIQTLEELVHIYNILVPSGQGVFLYFSEDKIYASLQFGQDLTKDELHSPVGQLRERQLIAFVFGLFCRAVSIGDESAVNIAKIITQIPFKDGDMSNEFAQWRKNALDEFNKELPVLRGMLDTLATK